MIQTSFGHTWIGFDNGYTVSIINGFGSYTENHFNIDLREEEKKPGARCITPTCEIAIIHEELGFVTKTFIPEAGDDVVGYVKPEELVDIINKVAAAEKLSE